MNKLNANDKMFFKIKIMLFSLFLSVLILLGGGLGMYYYHKHQILEQFKIIALHTSGKVYAANRDIENRLRQLEINKELGF
jgi:hypothetical protein